MRLGLVLMLATAAACQRKEPPPTCAAMAEHVLQLFKPVDDFARDVRDVFARRCVEDSWPDEMRDCVGSTATVVSPKSCKQKLPPAAAKKLESDLADAEKRESKREIPYECVHYERVLTSVLACDKLPKEVRDTLADRFAEAKAQWAGLRDTSGLKQICSSGIIALKQAALECPGAAKW